MKYMREVTSDWKTEYRVPSHVYIFDGSACVGYIKEGTKEEIMFKAPLKQFSKSRRKFVEVKNVSLL